MGRVVSAAVTRAFYPQAIAYPLTPKFSPPRLKLSTLLCAVHLYARYGLRWERIGIILLLALTPIVGVLMPIQLLRPNIWLISN